jgi:transcriptional regulator with XRE-family HTH domain
MTTTRTLGERLKEERERLKISQEVLGESAGVGRTAQYNYEQGKRSPDADYLIAVAAMGIDVVYLLSGQRLPPAMAGHMSAAASATLRVADEGVSRSYLDAVVSQAQGRALSGDEAALLDKFRQLPSEQRESFLQIVGALSSKRAARPRGRAGVSQVIHGDVGQVVKAQSVVTGDVVMGGKSRPKK